MTEEKEVEIIEAINEWITAAAIEYDEKGCGTAFYIKAINRVRGMIEVLQFVTGKEYGFNDDGVYEIKEAEV